MINDSNGTIHMHLHTHPRMEKNLSINSDHCIIDKSLYDIFYNMCVYNPIIFEYIKNNEYKTVTINNL